MRATSKSPWKDTRALGRIASSRAARDDPGHEDHRDRDIRRQHRVQAAAPLALLRHPHRRGPHRLQRVRQRGPHARAGRARPGSRRAAHRQGPHRGRKALPGHVPRGPPGAVRRHPAGHRRHRAGAVGSRGQVARRPRVAADGRAAPGASARVLVALRDVSGRELGALPREAPARDGRCGRLRPRGRRQGLYRAQDQHHLARATRRDASPRAAPAPTTSSPPATSSTRPWRRSGPCARRSARRSTSAST